MSVVKSDWCSKLPQVWYYNNGMRWQLVVNYCLGKEVKRVPMLNVYFSEYISWNRRQRADFGANELKK